jgi:ribosome-binding factor A
VSTQRAQRVAETIHKEISSLLIKGLKDPRIGFITITAVDVTPDLRHAKVFYTLMGNQTERAQNQSGLDSCAPYIRQHLGRHLRLRYVPEVRFEYDSSFDYGQRIEKLLSEVKPDEPQDDSKDP